LIGGFSFEKGINKTEKDNEVVMLDRGLV